MPVKRTTCRHCKHRHIPDPKTTREKLDGLGRRIVTTRCPKCQSRTGVVLKAVTPKRVVKRGYDRDNRGPRDEIA